MVNSECRSGLLTVPLLTIFTLLSCAQGKYGIEKISAYATERIPGNIPVDQQGEPIPSRVIPFIQYMLKPAKAILPGMLHGHRDALSQ